jgi:two-component system cell cycle sensor histidine kinase/response regulator CckA
MTESDRAENEFDRQRAEEELRRTWELLRAVADEVSDAIFVKDRGGKYLVFNKAAGRLTGKSAAEVLGRDDTAIFDLDSARDVMQRDRRIMAAGLAETQEEDLTANGVTRTYLATKAPYYDQHGNVGGVFGISRDITDWKRAEAVLRDREELYRLFTEKANDFIRLHDLTGRSIYCSPSVERLYGHVPTTLFEFQHPDDAETCRQWWERVLAGSDELLYWRVRSKDGAWRWLKTQASIVPYHGTPHVMTVCHDVTQRKAAQDALGRSERLLRQVLNALPVGVVVVDLSGDVILGNPASQRVWGGMITVGSERYAKSKGWWHATGKRIGPDEWPSMAAVTTGQASVKQLIDIEAFDGVRKVIENWSVPIRADDDSITGAVVINEDVTDVLRLEDQFRQAQKMEAVGHLAGGLAHDFNNLLTIINGFSELIQSQLPADHPARALALEISQAGERAASLTRQLLAFSRKQVIEPKVLNVNAIVTDTTKMLQRLIGEDVELNTVLDPELGCVRADPGQIEQALVNLAVNARDAMPEGGKLTIETGSAELDEAYTQPYPELRPGRYVMLAVSDTGVGMDEATKAHLFEPFFTTKGPEKGTGLGLATVYGIVKQSAGHIVVFSEPGTGTAFKIYLPLVEGVIPSGKSRADLQTPPHGNETILLAEDEPAVRALARHVLQLYGYTILEAGQGEMALQIAETYKGTIHLLVTDVVMPVMSGRQLADRLVAIRPGIKVLYLSGYTDDAVIRHGLLLAKTAFLQKPFTPSLLASKVREVLDQ